MPPPAVWRSLPPGGMVIASTGGTASGPAADGRPSMAASACAASASPKSASDGESSAPGPAGVIFSKNLSSSAGTGMTSVLFCSPATSTTVCSSRSCSATDTGWQGARSHVVTGNGGAAASATAAPRGQRSWPGSTRPVTPAGAGSSRRAYPAGHVIGVTVMTGPVPMPGGVPPSTKSRLHDQPAGRPPVVPTFCVPAAGMNLRPCRRRRMQCDAGAGERRRRTGSARTCCSVPLSRGELTIDRQRIVGIDLSSCRVSARPARSRRVNKPGSMRHRGAGEI